MAHAGPGSQSAAFARDDLGNARRFHRGVRVPNHGGENLGAGKAPGEHGLPLADTRGQIGLRPRVRSAARAPVGRVRRAARARGAGSSGQTKSQFLWGGSKSF